jgi:hypothetical protein
LTHHSIDTEEYPLAPHKPDALLETVDLIEVLLAIPALGINVTFAINLNPCGDGESRKHFYSYTCLPINAPNNPRLSFSTTAHTTASLTLILTQLIQYLNYEALVDPIRRQISLLK